MNEVRIKNGKQELTEDQEDLVEQNINDLLNLGIYSLPTLRISAKADERAWRTFLFALILVAKI